VDVPSLTLDGFGPLPVHRPTTVAEAGEVVRQMRDQRRAVYPVGGRSQLHVGRVPTRPGVALDTTDLAAVVDYPARDMTVTVQAGMRVADLDRLLAAENQRLPIDVPHPEATVGGILATNTSGPRRFGHGTLRDYLIGVSVLDDQGNETKAGGRVVKNVAGYDLCKLHVGALGTLGVVTQATFKLRPLPAARALVVAAVSGDQLEATLDALHATRTRPVVVEVLNRRMADAVGKLPQGEWVVVVGFEESPEAVAWQTSQLRTEIAAATVGDETLWDALVAATDSSGAVALKANLLPSAVADFCRALDRRPEPWRVQAHAGSGIVRASATKDVPLDALAATQSELAPLAAQAAGNIVLPRCPAAWKARLPVWGTPRGDVVVMRKVKHALDPLGLFNPGRFLEGIDV